MARNQRKHSLLPLLQKKSRQFLEQLQSGPRKFRKKDLETLSLFLDRYFQTRNERADQIDSPQLKKAVRIGAGLFPYPLYGTLCIDGRVLPVLFGGFTATFGKFLQLPAGKVTDFLPSDTREDLFLPKSSAFADMLKKALVEREENCVVQIFDSHIGCAARESEERSKGEDPHDHGLRADVVKKAFIAKATMEFVEKNYPGKKAITIQTSFNPHTGYLYMGLERKEVLRKAAVRGFTDQVLQELVSQGQVISTENLAASRDIARILKRYSFEPNWQQAYHTTALKFWQSMQALQEERQLLQTLKNQLLSLYPYLKGRDQQCRKELLQRTMLLLANLFSGYVNHQHASGQYPYGHHTERCVVVANKKHGPFPEDVGAFVVHVNDPDLAESIMLAETIVRNNRKHFNVLAAEQGQPLLAVNTPVLVMMQELLEEDLPVTDWEKLQKINWDDMPLDWREMDDDAFKNYLEKKNLGMRLHVGRKLNILRKRLAAIYDPRKRIARILIQKGLVAVPMLSDKNRRIHTIIPFYLNGYPEET